MQRIAELQQVIADFSKITRAIDIADAGRRENDVEHSFGLALTCWFLVPKMAPHLNMEKVLKYALAHDIVELHAGDTYILDKERVETKSEREDEAIEQIAADWPDFIELAEAAKKYKDRADPEATFVYVVDKILPAIMVNLGEKEAYWHKHKFTREMHEAENGSKMTISPEGELLMKMLNDWLTDPDHFYSETDSKQI